MIPTCSAEAKLTAEWAGIWKKVMEEIACAGQQAKAAIISKR
jgi:hypothetical protein